MPEINIEFDTTRVVGNAALNELLGADFVQVRPDRRVKRTEGVELIQEQPWHRQLASLLVAGTPAVQCAEIFGKTPMQISNVRRQTWFREHMRRLLAESGKNLLNLFEDQAAASLATVLEIRDNVEAPLKTRLDAAESILSRCLGRKTDTTVRHQQVNSPSVEEAELRKRLEQLQTQTAQ